MNITDYQLGLLHHTLGLKIDQREPYRNHFVAGPGHFDLSDLTALVDAGLMACRSAPSFCPETDMVFYATEAGKQYAIEHLPPVPKRSRYEEYLHSGCSDSFADFLGIRTPALQLKKIRVYPERYQYRYVRKASIYGSKYASDVIGEWCNTKKAAKESYKAVLKLSKQLDSELSHVD